EPLWNNRYIDHVQISVMETVGVEGRWNFYDQNGALRDMVQNHLLQLLCLLAMDPPHSLSQDASVHNAKLEVLLSLRHFEQDTINNIIRGQYTEGLMDGKPVPGYLSEEGAQKNSNTETFVAVKAHIDNWRWAGVPFYLRTGKRLQKRYSEIVVQFKDVPHRVFSGTSPNRLVIRLQPDEGISLHLMNKVPGIDTFVNLKETSLDLFFGEAFEGQSIPDAYERLLLDVLRTNSTLFIRSDELELAWKWVDGIVDIWQAGQQKPIPYISGSMGPAESITMLANEGRSWY
ncbi:MAG: glucose-6-phosphate dehydrogenase, partial [Gammaproteobacteria bacterium]